VIDHVYISRPLDRFQLQAELLLNRREEAGRWICGVGVCVVGRPCENEIVPASNAGLIDYWPIKKTLHAEGKVGHGVVGESSAAAARAT